MNSISLRVAPLVLALSACFFTEKVDAQGAQPKPAGQSEPTAVPATRESEALPSLAPLVDSVKAAVVNVDVQTRGGGGGEQGAPGSEFWDQFFGNRQGGRGAPPQERLRKGLGSGFIIDPKGLVLTNNHVVEGAVNIRVKLNDGRTFDADVLGRDPPTDVALIRLKGKIENLPSVKLGDSNNTRVGDWVLAIGNPFGLASSVSLGIVSAKAREINVGPYDDFIQTDAAINPGNSGGPLFNMKGDVIGINTAIVGGASGIGFTVPSNLAKALLPQLEKGGAVTRGWLGVGIQDLTPDLAKALGVPVSEGALVGSVNDGSPAKKAGVQPDDVITAIDGQKVTSGGTLTRTVALKKPGSTSTLTVYRAGKPRDVKIQLGTRPDIDQVAQRGSTPKEDEGSRLRIGVVLSDVDPRLAEANGLPKQGALITDVVPGSPAERADLQPSMVVVEADRKPVRSADELLRVLKGAKAGSTLLLRVQVPGSNSRLLRALNVP
ncbi:MAG TPA: trypsin-like peptidase domain-containing protein [Myxococcaceae bacterium]|nr:trypsin-like peptidase domain-containing protein [Myxococcaceae bacterium]